mgnify:CR=1 FL=1
MLKVKLARYSGLPDEVNDMYLPDRRKGKEYAGYLLVYDGYKLIRVESDDIQPEDVSFTRDLNWIKDAIQNAYKKGIRDGKKLERWNKNA